MILEYHKVIKRALKKNCIINTSEVNLDEDHSPPEALGFALQAISSHISCEVWKRVTVASMYSSLSLVSTVPIHM